MTTLTALLTHAPGVAAALVVLALLMIGLAIWILLPRRDDPEADIERQISTLRQGADHAVATRPRVRAGQSVKPKACGGGLCRHRADCSDLYCPGRMSANLAAGDRRASR